MYTCSTLREHLPDLGKFELFAARLTDLRVQNVKALHFDLSPYLDLTHDLNNKILTMGKLHLDGSFVTPPLPSHYDA